MEGHEFYEIDYEAGTATYLRTVPLCHFCHNYIHDGRMIVLRAKNKFPTQKFVSIIQHGDAVLLKAGLKRLPHNQRDQAIMDQIESGKVAAWQDWRLILNGQEYEPKFKSYEEWIAGHAEED